jgi:hypothetical protein
MPNPVPGPEFMLAVGKARQGALLKDIERRQATREASPARSRHLDRLLAGIGDALISAGTKLQESRFYQEDYQAAKR